MKKIIVSLEAPSAIGPYSQAISFQHLIFTSGQIPLDAKTGQIPSTIEEQVPLAMANCFAILKAAGSGPNQVLKTTIFVQNIAHFSIINSIYESYFQQGNYPARSLVEVARLPKNVLIEIEMIAYKG